jgi:coenzyme F420-reducing hydrogenase beta subunit
MSDSKIEPETVQEDSTAENVCTEIVVNDLCVGCGTCAAVCPQRNLQIEFNKYGEYVATNNGSKCSDACGVCLKVCPFSNQLENEDVLGLKLFADIPGIKYTEATGYYLDEAFVGYSAADDRRQNGASGGFATWMLEELLRKRLVDYVACVSPTTELSKLFKFVLATTTAKVRSCSKSCYYPVEISEVIRSILANGEKKYAVIGLPCVCKAIRLAMQHNSKLRRRIKFILGLVCGQSKSKFFAEYICAHGGGDPKTLNHIVFRNKDPKQPASNYSMKFSWTDQQQQRQEGTIFYKNGLNSIWNDRFFTPRGCGYCDDLFSELSDVTFMDAWLPRYAGDWLGHSIVLFRNPTLYSVFTEAISKSRITAARIDMADVLKSQQGGIRTKRAQITERIRLATENGQEVPRKRSSKHSKKLTFGEKWLVREQEAASQRSREEWQAAKGNLLQFVKEMKSNIIRLRIARFMMKLERIPGGGIRRIRKVAQWR